MRRRQFQRGPWVFLAALLISLGVHVVGGLQLSDFLNQLLLRGKSKNQDQASRVVQLTPQAFDQSLERAKKLVRSRPPSEVRRPKPKRQQPKRGQVVEVPSQNRKRPKNARFLAAEDSSVEKETRARPELRDESLDRVTNRLQRRAAGEANQQPLARREETPAPSNSPAGREGNSPRPGPGGRGRADRRRRQARSEDAGKSRTRRASELDLDIKDLLKEGTHGVEEGRAPARTSNGDENARDRQNMEPGQQKIGSGNGQGLPSLDQLKPTLGTLARIAGSPSDDYIPDVVDGEGNFLNTVSFKYATFFYQIRRSIGPHWRSYIRNEIGRRDPTGDIFGPGSLITRLQIRLDDSGKLQEVKVAKSSGHEFVDSLAVRAFKNADSFPNPPKGMVNDQGFITFTWAFHLQLGGRGPLNIFR